LTNEETKFEKKTIKGDAEKSNEENDEVQYEATFKLGEDFGKVGAVLVENEQSKEMFLKSIVLDGFPHGPLHVTCDSWLQPKDHVKRVFFIDKVSIKKKLNIFLILMLQHKIKIRPCFKI